MQTAPASKELLFVEDGIGRRKRSKQARAHVAKVNRQKQKDEKLKRRDGGIDGESKSAASSTRTTSTSEQLETALSSSYSNLSGNRLRGPAADGKPSSTPRSSAYSWRRHSVLTSPHSMVTISPTFGGQQMNSHNMELYPDAVEVADFCFNYVMNNWLAPEFKPAWFAAFSQDPLTYHCLSYSVGVLQDVSNGRPLQHQRLVHRHRTIQLVNQQLGNLQTVDPEPIILAIVTLWRINTGQVLEQKELPLLFLPHARSANSVLLFGKLGGEDGHSNALVHLVKRVGGLDKFKTLPGLQDTLALADLLDSSAKAEHPNFLSIWTPQVHLDVLDPALRLLGDDIEGQGFQTKIPGGLPLHMLTMLQRLSTLDKLLDDFSSRSVGANEEYSVTLLGYAVQHYLLSLAPWQTLTETQQEESCLAWYELCRITAILYANSVIFPMSPSEKWLGKLLKQFRQLIETSSMALWDEDTAPLLIWALMIGGMASFWTSHQTFFSARFRQIMAKFQISTWSEVHVIVKQFLWRDSSCGQGAATFWNHVQIGDESI